jgi:hypothetical protein
MYHYKKLSTKGCKSLKGSRGLKGSKGLPAGAKRRRVQGVQKVI